AGVRPPVGPACRHNRSHVTRKADHLERMGTTPLGLRKGARKETADDIRVVSLNEQIRHPSAPETELRGVLPRERRVSYEPGPLVRCEQDRRMVVRRNAEVPPEVFGGPVGQESLLLPRLSQPEIVEVLTGRLWINDLDAQPTPPIGRATTSSVRPEQRRAGRSHDCGQ